MYSTHVALCLNINVLTFRNVRLSGNIRRNLNYLGIYFNEDAVVVLSKHDIPVYVKFAASLGKSFNYCKPLDFSSIIDSLITMDKITSSCERFDDLFFTRHRTNDIKRALTNNETINILEQNEPSDAQTYIYELVLKASSFLRKNRNIMIVTADKGGKIVIMDKHNYIEKAYAHLNENTAANNYALVHEDFATVIRPIIEKQYSTIAAIISPYMIMDGTIRRPLSSESYSLPLFYGCPKIQKIGVPLRPIIASVNMIGDILSTWLLNKLNLVALRMNKYNINNVSQIVPSLKHFRLEDNHELYTMDYVSMFTNISVTETTKIIEENYDAIAVTTSVPCDVFTKCLNFFTTDSAIFGFNGQLYKQTKGLAMGNRLAQILAEIRTNHAMLIAIQNISAEIISLLYKYVDDTFISIHTDHLESIALAISKTVGMNITLTNENVNNEVDFLDCTFKRNPDGSISTRWFKKYSSAMAILNFHSYHPWSMKYNVVYQMVKNAITMTSAEFLSTTIDMLTTILRRSSYPEPFIASILRLKPNDINRNIIITDTNSAKPRRFISCPFYQPLFDELKSLIAENGLPIHLAPAPFANNRSLLLSNSKDKRPITMNKMTMFRISCYDCSFTFISKNDLLDVHSTTRKLLADSTSLLAQHLSSFPSHTLSDTPEIIKVFRSLCDVRRSQNVITDVKRILPMRS